MSNTLKICLVFILGVVLGVIVFWLIDRSLGGTNLVNEALDSARGNTNQFILKKQVMAWLPSWDQDEAFQSVQDNKDKISVIKPVWYKVRKNGTLKKFTGAENQEIIKFAKQNNIKIIPVITNDCDPYASEQVLKNAKVADRNITNIMHKVTSFKYDGIEPNYECMHGLKYRPLLTSFMQKLSNKLHAKGKLLSTALHAKTTDKGTWEGPASQDWKALSKYCDQLKLMTYDYHWSTSDAGDIAPVSWMKGVLAYAVKIIPKNKIYLGIPFYGYDWQGQTAKDLVYQDVLDLIDQYQPSVKISSGPEKYFSYTAEDGKSHTVYYLDHEVLPKRLDLVKTYNIAGIGIWRLGQEDPANWQVIADKFK
jgi:spore germination protein YaaH